LNLPLFVACVAREHTPVIPAKAGIQ